MYITRSSFIRGLLLAIVGSIIFFIIATINGLSEESVIVNMIGTGIIVFLFGAIRTKKE